MGAKFYRANYHSKKLRKRATQTRTWARTLKWVCCKFFSCTYVFVTLIIRSRTSSFDRWSPLQGWLDRLHWYAR